MQAGVQVVLSGALTFGVPLVLAVRELWALNRGASASRPGDDPTGHAPPGPLPEGDSSLPPLPACLDPARWPDLLGEEASRSRVLEDA